MCYARTQQIEIKKVCIRCGWEVETEEAVGSTPEAVKSQSKGKMQGHP